MVIDVIYGLGVKNFYFGSANQPLVARAPTPLERYYLVYHGTIPYGTTSSPGCAHLEGG